VFVRTHILHRRFEVFSVLCAVLVNVVVKKAPHLRRLCACQTRGFFTSRVAFKQAREEDLGGRENCKQWPSCSPGPICGGCPFWPMLALETPPPSAFLVRFGPGVASRVVPANATGHKCGALEDSGDHLGRSLRQHTQRGWWPGQPLLRGGSPIFRVFRWPNPSAFEGLFPKEGTWPRREGENGFLSYGAGDASRRTQVHRAVLHTGEEVAVKVGPLLNGDSSSGSMLPFGGKLTPPLNARSLCR
jgi:hypothetical protein